MFEEKIIEFAKSRKGFFSVNDVAIFFDWEVNRTFAIIKTLVNENILCCIGRPSNKKETSFKKKMYKIEQSNGSPI